MQRGLHGQTVAIITDDLDDNLTEYNNTCHVRDAWSERVRHLRETVTHLRKDGDGRGANGGT